MPSFLNTSLTGMLAFQRALTVTSHNIANASTPGYSRQIAEFTARSGTGFADSQMGGGTRLSTIRRVYDSILTQQLQASTTGLKRFDTLNGLAGRIDTLLADPDTGLNSALQSFFGALQDLSNDPASIPTRQALLGEADGIASRFQSLDRQFTALEAEVGQRLRISVDDINQLAASIASVNERIVAASGTDFPPNDLLDERDRLVLALSGQVSVATVVQDDGAMNVFIGAGQSLVSGSQVLGLSVRGSEFDPTRLNVVYDGASGEAPLDDAITGGALGGLLEFRANMLEPAKQALGQTAVSFAQSFNAQHAAGMNLRGNLGGEFFAIESVAVLPSANNTGSGSATVSIADLGAYTGANYVLEYDGAAYSLARQDTGEVIPMSGSGSATDPFVAAGMQIQAGGGPAAGDRLLIRSGQGAAASIRTQISEALDIAVAGPTRSAASFANTGSATISATSIDDIGDPALLTPSVIEFLSPGSYSINGAGAFTYDDGEPIIVNGTKVTISGPALAGDQFTIEPNYGASGDNRNGLLLADVQAVGVLDGGAISIGDNYGRLVASVGGMTHQIQAGLDAQSVVRLNAEEAVLAGSAVNLDEEAARLIQYQQSYQALAQLVGVASTLFESLLNATRR